MKIKNKGFTRVPPRRIRRGIRGFTFVEVVAVVAIIGVLVAIIIPQVTKTIAKGRDARRMADIKSIASALQAYYMDNSAYPDAASLTKSTDSNFLSALSSGGYLAQVPKDPKNDSTYYYCYQKFSAGTYSAPSARGPYVLIGCKAFEVLSSVAGVGNSIASGYDWNSNYAFYILLFER
jgi:type II secretion system protein G